MRASTPRPVALWILFCAYCNLAGWVLSALHQLTAAGYAISFLLGAGCFAGLKHQIFERGYAARSWHKIKQRFRQPFPLAFGVLAVLAALGGILYAPNNYDALAYRVPRVLHWLAAGQWHWIHTDFQRVNTRACGMEWLSAPLILLTRTDRFLFLINIVSFLLLPGLVFSLFVRMGVRSRAAWHWMWLLPSGYCYILQAGSISNDMFSTVFSLAAIDFALRAHKSGRFAHAALALLAASLMIGAKTSNLPLLLPCVVALAPTWRTWLRRPILAAALLAPALCASCLPMAWLNYVHCGDWTGMAAEDVHIGSGPVWVHLVNNAINYIASNIVPPVFPFAAAWNRAADAMTPPRLAAEMQRYFEPWAAHFRMSELQIEEVAGLGFGVTILLALSVAATLRRGRSKACANGSVVGGRWRALLCLAPWISLFYLMEKANMSGATRYLASYYPLLSLALLRGSHHSLLTRRPWWRLWAFFSSFLAAILLVLSPARPLWPANWFFQNTGSKLGGKFGLRVAEVYAVQGARPAAFARAVAMLPAEASVVGFMADDYPETSLWKPFGSRRIVHVKVSDSMAEVRGCGIKYVLAVTNKLQEPWPQWLARMDAKELNSVELKLRGQHAPYQWHLVEIDSNGRGQ